MIDLKKKPKKRKNRLTYIEINFDKSKFVMSLLIRKPVERRNLID